MANLEYYRVKTDRLSLESIKRQLVLVGGFLAGCLLGGLLAKWIGLQAVIVPVLTLAVFYFSRKGRRLS